MDIGTNLNLNRFVNFSRMATPLLIIGSWILRIYALYEIALIIGLFWILAALILWLGSTNCFAPGCAGKMEVTTRRLSFWTAEMTFTCKQCGVVYEEKIFNPNFEITFEVSS